MTTTTGQAPERLVMLLRILANPPRHRDSRNIKAAYAVHQAEALALASQIEAAAESSGNG